MVRGQPPRTGAMHPTAQVHQCGLLISELRRPEGGTYSREASAPSTEYHIRGRINSSGDLQNYSIQFLCRKAIKIDVCESPFQKNNGQLILEPSPVAVSVNRIPIG